MALKITDSSLLTIPTIDHRYRVDVRTREIVSFAVKGSPTSIAEEGVVLRRGGGGRVRVRTIDGRVIGMSCRVAYFQALAHHEHHEWADDEAPAMIATMMQSAAGKVTRPSLEEGVLTALNQTVKDTATEVDRLATVTERIESQLARLSAAVGLSASTEEDVPQAPTMGVWAYISRHLISTLGLHEAALFVGAGVRAMEKWAQGLHDPMDEHQGMLDYAYTLLRAYQLNISDDDILSVGANSRKIRMTRLDSLANSTRDT